LAVISKVLNIGENLAGVTILAFGNGSPDIFTAIANPEGDTELMYSELMGKTAGCMFTCTGNLYYVLNLGAAIFVTTVVAGCIIMINPFVLEKFSFVRDTLFFTFSIVYISECIADGKYSLAEGIGKRCKINSNLKKCKN
jgi:solute carrier family 24 (sodium/potassium/calcium exchanger), member 6